MLQPNRLFNERMCVLVVGRGEWVEYRIKASASPNLMLGLALLVAAAVIFGACAATVRLLLASSRRGPSSESSEPVGAAKGRV